MKTDSLKQDYLERIVPILTKEFGYTTVMQVPRLEKIHAGVSIGFHDKNYRHSIMKTAITGQKL